MPFPTQTGPPVGTAWKILAPAKLNLYLEVLGRRADGFHDLETLMVPVRIYDDLSYTPSSEGDLSVRVRAASSKQSNVSLLGEDDDNLVLRAARLAAEYAGVPASGRFDLVKRIPVQAGMGGGSSDAAAALLLVNEAWNLGLNQEQLMTLGAQLGSDVPFFLRPGSAICRGRGELVEAVDRLPRLHFVIAKPPAGLSTPKVFAQLAEDADFVGAETCRQQLSGLVNSLRTGALSAAAGKMSNRLEWAARKLAPWLVQLRELFSRAGCVGQFMTGSGSAYVGVMRSARHARQAAGWMKNFNSKMGMNVGQVFATSSC